MHADDEAEGGRVARLARDVIAAYELLTGEQIELFLDRDALEWGDNWRAKIDASLAGVAFFVPVLTPRFFASSECRGELQSFARRASDLGLRELLLPLLYVDVPGMDDDPPGDDLVALVKPFQWENWTDLRFTEPDSEKYRRAVDRLAVRLVKANAEAERTDVAEAAVQMEEALDAPGWLDQVGDSLAALPEWAETLQAIGSEVEAIGKVMQQGRKDIETGEQRGKGIAARLVVAKRIAMELERPAENVRSFGDQFASQLHAVDAGVRIMIDRMPEEIEGDPESKEKACEFFNTLAQVSSQAHSALGNVQRLVESIAPLEAMSRDLRKPLRRLREGLTVMVEARDVTDDWVRLIDQTGVDCSGYAGTEPEAQEIGQ